ncbi:hypothetical protein FQN54_003388 [Arachnomyces sp. PD_36]|nr:hypothetical protein FQN54_003388 [Arachnomyces sp. PD_36]
MAMPSIIGTVTTDLSGGRIPSFGILALFGVGFIFSTSFAGLFREVISFKLQTRICNSLAKHTFNHVMDLSAEYHLSKNTPAVVTAVNSSERVMRLVVRLVFLVLPTLVDLLVAHIIILSQHGISPLCMLFLTSILVMGLGHVTMELRSDRDRAALAAKQRLFSQTFESFFLWKTIAELSGIEQQKTRQMQQIKEMEEKGEKSKILAVGVEFGRDLIISTSLLVVGLIKIREIRDGVIDWGQCAALMTYWSRTLYSLNRILEAVDDLSSCVVEVEKLASLLDMEPPVTEGEERPIYKGASIRFKDVTFGYKERPNVVNNLSLEVSAGSKIALVGETGGGKSTTLSLLYRFFEPQRGAIFVDDQNIRTIDLEAHRARIGIVSQNSILFNRTIFDNMRYANCDATEDEIIKACKAACIHDSIQRYPNGYEQNVGELSQHLSGGEKQRLAIARLFVQKPEIVLLDEVTSSMDSITEAKVLEALNTFCKGRTTIIVAHRLSTVMDVDEIVVIKGVSIVAEGAPHALAACKDSEFGHMVSLQEKKHAIYENGKARSLV